MAISEVIETNAPGKNRERGQSTDCVAVVKRQRVEEMKQPNGLNRQIGHHHFRIDRRSHASHAVALSACFAQSETAQANAP